MEDEYIRQTKNREPIQSIHSRVRLLQELRCVHGVMMADSTETYLRLIQLHQPWAITVGNDYRGKEHLIVGIDDVKAVYFTGPRAKGLSSTEIINASQV